MVPFRGTLQDSSASPRLVISPFLSFFDQENFRSTSKCNAWDRKVIIEGQLVTSNFILIFHWNLTIFFFAFCKYRSYTRSVMSHVYVSFRDDDSSPDVWQTPKSAPETICSKRRRQFKRRADELVQSVRFSNISALTLNLLKIKLNLKKFIFRHFYKFW